ncbi:MAG: putative autotransporter proteinputative Ig protein, partial [Verrucomicrobiaceae bacterium]|nr:putative autotransporter proteinputative Ig protein [Verrucomicrobiaceae bacterium]
LASSTSATTDNGVDNNNDGVQSGGQGTAVRSSIFTLIAAKEPGTAGVTNDENTIDFGLRPCPTISITPASLTAATGNSFYTVTLTASGGSSAYAWAMASGTLPTGLTLVSSGAATATISGSPSAAPGTYSFTVKATDSLGCIGTKAYSLTINCPTLTISPVSPLTNVTAYSAYDVTLTAGTGTAPYTWSMPTGALPAGLTLSTSGASTAHISGTTTATSGSFPFTIRVKDANNCQTDLPYTVTVVCPTLNVGVTGSTTGALNVAMSITLTVSSGGSPYNWALLSGPLPPGLVLTKTGATTATISGTPTTPGSYNVTVRTTDTNGCTGDKPLNISISCPPIIISPPGPLADATQTLPYSVSFTQSGGNTPVAWSLVSGAGNLPTGLTLNASTGVMSGTPTGAVGTYNFTVKVTDVNNCVGTQSYSLLLNCQPLIIQPATLNNGTGGFPYTATLSTQRGTAPFIWSVLSGSLPSGLNLSGSTISGTPTVLGTSSFTIRVADATGCVDTKAYTLMVVCPTLSIDPVSLPDGYVSAAYSQQLTASGGTAPYTWSVTAGTLPSWLQLNASTGQVSGTAPATAATASSFTVKAAGLYGCSTTRTYSVGVRSLSIGSLVWHDADYNGLRGVSEVGIGGASVQLFTLGADGVANTADDVQVQATQLTTPSGGYRFSGLPAADYYVKVTPPSGFPLSGGNVVTTNNGVDNDNNAMQPGGVGTAFISPVVHLQGGNQATVDDGDADTDLTVDFGLFPGMCIGDLVWNDTNNNGLHDSGEAGVAGVTVQIFKPGADNRVGGVDDVLAASAITDVNGLYKVCDLMPGKYYVKLLDLPWWAPLASSVANVRDDGVDNDSNVIQVGAGTIYSPLITLSALSEPGNISSGVQEDTTVDFGIYGYPVAAFVTASLDDSIPVFEPETGAYCYTFHQPFGNSNSQGNNDRGDTPAGIKLGPDGNFYVAHYGASNLRKISPGGTDLGPFLSTGAGINKISSFACGPDGNFLVLDEGGKRLVRFAGPLSPTPGQPLDPSPYTFIDQEATDLRMGPDGNIYLLTSGSGGTAIKRYNASTGALLNTIVNQAQLVNMVAGGSSVAEITGFDI